MDALTAVTRFGEGRVPEKIYIHTDKPYYTVGDTLWFKAYLFNAAYLTASAKSGIAYIEIANGQNEVVKRLMVSLNIGLGWGNIALNEREFPQGSYCLRAYTNWMRNFDGDYIFEKKIYISSASEKDMLINAKISAVDETGKQIAHVKMALTMSDQKPVRLTDFQLKIIQGNKVWYKDKVSTSLDGTIDFNFGISEKADTHNLSITLQNLKKGDSSLVYKVPAIFKRPENIDLQFMPEGGSLVAGLGSHIAFKALAEDGNSTDVSGTVYNSKQQEVLTFKSAHWGMGSFNLRPLAGETYTAKIILPDGSYSKAYPMPPVKPSGTVLRVVNRFASDSLEVTISTTADIGAADAAFYLIGQSRGVACYGALISKYSSEVKTKISKALFPTGIARLTLLNAAKQPLNERIVYIDHDDHLRIGINANKKTYAQRDSAGLDIFVTDKDGRPVQGSFSVAVTDDAQIKDDSLQYNTLKLAMLLTTDLKGNIEYPGYYFPSVATAEIWQDLDNLLLAQGWVYYDWGAVFTAPKAALFNPEPNFSVKGLVTNVFNKPVEKAGVVLLSKKPAFLRDTVTDKAGLFNFTDIYPSDTAVFFIQAKNKRGKSMNVNVTIDEFKPPVFKAFTERIMPWYFNTDSTRGKTMSNYVAYKRDQDVLTGTRGLKEVKILDKKIIKGSKNLNGEGGSDFALSQEDLEKAGKVTLGELLKKYYKDFGFITVNPNLFKYRINFLNFHLIIDGIDVDFASSYEPYSYDHIFYIKSFLDYYKAEDIKGIEVMTTSKYSATYTNTFLGPLALPSANAFVEVTTYGGTGPYLKSTPGTYIYRPVAFAPQKQFYSPKYKSKVNGTFADARSTVYWSPNIITDKNGKAKFSFYTTDKTGTYTLLIDGCDMNGNVESARQKIIVK